MSWLPLNRGKKLSPSTDGWYSAHTIKKPKINFVKPPYPCTNLPLSENGKKWYENRKIEAASVPDGSRKRLDRQQLIGYPHCSMWKYFDSLNLTPDSKRRVIDEKSFWRFKRTPPKTPDNYWDVQIPDTPECIRRGYVNASCLFAPFHMNSYGKRSMKHVAYVYPDGQVNYVSNESEQWALVQKPKYTKEYIVSGYSCINGKVTPLKEGSSPLKLKLSGEKSDSQNDSKMNAVRKLNI